MKTPKTFEHNDSDFEIKAALSDGVWNVYVFCDGIEIGEPKIVSDQVVLAAAANKIMLLRQIADELEKIVRKMSDLKIANRT